MYLIIKLKEKAGKISLRQRCNPYALQGKNRAIQKAERTGGASYIILFQLKLKLHPNLIQINL